MKKFVILFALIALACAAPVSEENEEKKESIAIVRSERGQNEDGSYNFGYEGADGTAREETADIINKDTEDEALVITGSYRYIDANGEEVVVNYTAGKDGFVPIGSNIPREITDVAQAAKSLPPEVDSDGEPDENLGVPRG